MAAFLGCIADDFTGGTDLANNLVRGGMRVIQTGGIPADDSTFDADAIIVSLKIRSISPEEAVTQAVSALQWLKKQGCKRFYWKYCSTFDSTPKGNIGPVSEALLKELGAEQTVICPAFPATGRTVYKGLLFVGDILLEESGMRDHPVTPMRDSSLQRLLAPQVEAAVGNIMFETIQRGAEAVRTAFTALAAKSIRYVITDAITDEHLQVLADACCEMPLLTGGSGLATGLPMAWEHAGLFKCSTAAAGKINVTGKIAILSGSCSVATREQLAEFSHSGAPFLRLDPFILKDEAAIAEFIQEACILSQNTSGPIVIYAGDDPESVAAVQKAMGKDASGALIEDTLARVAVALRKQGVRRFIVAGGETSGAIVTALGIKAMRIGEQIAPGVPWTVSVEKESLALALKSGNFGGKDFFEKAIACLC